jgi:hypothetical protein
MLFGAAAAENGASLAKKAMVFEQDMNRRFLLDGQALCKLAAPTPQRPDVTYNMPDNAYMTGIYLGTLAMKYAVTKDPADRAAAAASIRGLHLLCTVSGKKGVLARAAWPPDKPFADDGTWRDSPDGKHKWRGDVSSDQMTGVMFGFALAYDLAADDEGKRIIAQDVSDLVQTLLDNGLMIIDVDGKPTRFGKYMPQYVKLFEPMNALLLLQHLKVAHHVTGNDRFAPEYRRLAVDEGYAEVAVRARRTLGKVNFSDDVLLYLAYYPLLTYETDPTLKGLYVKSLRRTWEGGGRVPGAKAQGNPFYAFIAHAFLGDDSGVAAGIDTLKWFPLDLKWNRATITAYEKEFGFTFQPGPVSPAPKPGEAVPVDRRQKTWSAWVQDPYAEAGDRTADAPMEFNGHDYLAAYWLGRHLGLIQPAM